MKNHLSKGFYDLCQLWVQSEEWKQHHNPHLSVELFRIFLQEYTQDQDWLDAFENLYKKYLSKVDRKNRLEGYVPIDILAHWLKTSNMDDALSLPVLEIKLKDCEIPKEISKYMCKDFNYDYGKEPK